MRAFNVSILRGFRHAKELKRKGRHLPPLFHNQKHCPQSADSPSFSRFVQETQIFLVKITRGNVRF